MKIVLIDEVENLGIAGDVLDVKPGYARNYLIPKHFAVKANVAELARAESRRKVEVERRTKLNTAVEGFVGELEAEPLVMEVRVGPAGRLYGSVTAAEIAEALSERIGKELDRHAIALPQPIREVGVQSIRVRLAPDVFANLNVSVEPTGGLPKASVAEATTATEEAASEPTIEEALEAEETRIAEEAASAELDQPTAEAIAVEDEDEATADDDATEAEEASKD